MCFYFVFLFFIFVWITMQIIILKSHAPKFIASVLTFERKNHNKTYISAMQTSRIWVWWQPHIFQLWTWTHFNCVCVCVCVCNFGWFLFLCLFLACFLFAVVERIEIIFMGICFAILSIDFSDPMFIKAIYYLTKTIDKHNICVCMQYDNGRSAISILFSLLLLLFTFKINLIFFFCSFIHTKIYAAWI